MHIKKAIETDAGAFEIEGHFTPEEVQVILEVGLNTLFKTGSLPFKSVPITDAAGFSPFTGQA